MAEIDKYINQIICGDAIQILRMFPDNYIDLVITSPPYNMGNKSLGYQPLSTVGQKHYDMYDDNKSEQEYIEWCFAILDECLRISRYVFWNVQFVRSTRRMIIELQSRYYNNLKDIFVWHKKAVSNIISINGGMARGWEYVFMLGNNNTSTFEYNNFPSNGYVPNIQTWYKSEFFKEHHATFPIELPNYFIQYFTKPNDIVLDPMCGSGTTLVSAKQLGRQYIGIDISLSYCILSQKRLKSITPPLFTI